MKQFKLCPIFLQHIQLFVDSKMTKVKTDWNLIIIVMSSKSQKYFSDYSQFRTIHNRERIMSSIDPDEVSSMSSVDTFAPVAVYRLKYYQPESVLDNVFNALIRPPRFVYNEKLLIPGRRYQQKFDYEVHNIPFPLSIYWAENPKYIILYLHGNSSSRFQGYLHLKQLPEGACLACFDFKGCGLRKDGKYITLGKQQSIQVDIAVQYLKAYGYPIIGWGRSMGAVSLLMSTKCDIMIADSPFCSLYDLCKETSLNFLPSGLCCLVHCLFPCIFSCVRSGVQRRSGMDPSQLQIIKAVEKQSPTKSLLLLAGKSDSMIHYSHAQRLHDAFTGKSKRLILFDGTHNSNRPQEVFDQCFNFIEDAIGRMSNGNRKVIRPAEFQSKCKVVRIEREVSVRGSIGNANNGTMVVNMSECRDFQSSKQTLLIPIKSPAQLRPLRVTPLKTSPKKFSKIECKSQLNQQRQIQINHQQQKIICQGIGKFEKNILQLKTHKQTFQQISYRNSVENSDTPKRQIVVKSMGPIKVNHQVSGRAVEMSYRYEEKEVRKSNQLETLGSTSSKLVGKQNNQVVRDEGKLTLVQDNLIVSQAENVVAPIKLQPKLIDKTLQTKCEINTPSSQLSTIQYEERINLPSNENFQTLNFNTNRTTEIQNLKLVETEPLKRYSADPESKEQGKSDKCETFPVTINPNEMS